MRRIGIPEGNFPNRDLTFGADSYPFLSGGPREEINTRTGGQYDEEFTGSLAECQAKKAALLEAGFSQVTLQPNGVGDWIVTGQMSTALDGTQGVPMPSINELETNVLQTSIYRSPVLRGILGSLADATIAIVQEVIRDYEGGKYATSSNPAVSAAGDCGSKVTALGGTTDQGDAAYDLFMSVVSLQTEYFTNYTSVYRRTLTAATYVDTDLSFTGQGKIWTTAEVLLFEFGLSLPGDDPWTKGVVPGVMWNAMQDSQWLKSRPQVLAVAAQKTQVIYSYTECFMANHLCYEAYDSAVLL